MVTQETYLRLKDVVSPPELSVQLLQMMKSGCGKEELIEFISFHAGEARKILALEGIPYDEWMAAVFVYDPVVVRNSGKAASTVRNFLKS